MLRLSRKLFHQVSLPCRERRTTGILNKNGARPVGDQENFDARAPQAIRWNDLFDSNSRGLRMKLHAECAHDFQDSGKTRVAFFSQRLVEALTT
jgi:hypothetical protein